MFFSGSIQAQSTKIDSFNKKLLIHIVKDTIRVNLLNGLAYLYYNKDLAKTIESITIEDLQKHNEQGTTVMLVIPYKIFKA